VPTEAAAVQSRRSIGDMLRMRRAVGRESLDVFFFPTVYTYFPMPRRVSTVVGIHDAIAERFPELTLPSLRSRWFWSMKVRWAIRQARLILTVSEFSADEIVEVLGVPRDRVRVVLEAPSDVFFPVEDEEEIAGVAATHGLPVGAEWFIYVGGFNPHKNVDSVVRAHARVTKGRENPPHLLLVGTLDGDVFHGNRDSILETIRREGTEDLVHWTGFVADEQLRCLHSGAIALVFPSACEGFGLPAVEAAACGTPVIATTASPLPGLLEGGGEFVDPGDDKILVDAMNVLLEDLDRRWRMGEVGRERAKALTWEGSARTVLEVLAEAAA